MMRLEAFQPEHFWLVNGREGKPTEDHAAVPRFYYDSSFFVAWTGKIHRSAFTVFDGDKVLGCAGVAMLPGKGEVWMHISKDVADAPLWLTRTARGVLTDIARACSSARFFECFIPIGNLANRRWIERALGFKDTGLAIVRGEPCRHYTQEVY